MTTRALIVPAASQPAAAGGEAPSAVAGLLSPSAWISLGAGGLTAFTVTLVGEMPVGEFLLMAAAGWAGLCLAFNGAWPSPLLRDGLLRAFLAAQAVALCAYVVADLYWNSSPHDMARGWSRMIFLAIDLVAVAYLFGCARRNFLVFLSGLCLGQVASALLLGPEFGDFWKFGFAESVTYLVLLVAPWTGPGGTVAAAAGLAALNFAMDYRSLCGLSLAVAVLTLLQMAPRRFRLWLGVLAVAGSVLATPVLYRSSQTEDEGRRTTRSDIERSAMLVAATEAFEKSPLIGHGSWFSNSKVYDNFLEIRHAAAVAAHVGGFADANTDPGKVAIHSQILVALAEGGLFGGTFFFLFGGALLWALYDTVFVQAWCRLSPACTMILLWALWNLLFSPFSGAHRVYIAMACGLILRQRHDRRVRQLEGEPLPS